MDKIFKIGLLVLGFSYLAYLFCPVANQVGRYSYHEDSHSMRAFDTSTGLLYCCDDRYKPIYDAGVLDIIRLVKAEAEDKKLLEKLREKNK
jgi:predicted amidophosphoribosyltransferase